MHSRSIDEITAEEVRVPPFVVWPILPKRGKMLLYAPAKTGKSTLLFNIAYDLGEGTPILQQSRWTPRDVSTVLIVEQELGKYGSKDKLDRIHAYRGGVAAGQNVRIVSKDRRFKLDTPEGLGSLSRELKLCVDHWGRLDVLVLDPIRKFHGRDENDSTEITSVVESMDRLIEEFGCAIIFSHHTGHPSERSPNGHPRGSTIWQDEADSILKVTRVAPGNKKLIRITVDELRFAEPPPHFHLELNPDTYTYEVR